MWQVQISVGICMCLKDVCTLCRGLKPSFAPLDATIMLYIVRISLLYHAQKGVHPLQIICGFLLELLLSLKMTVIVAAFKIIAEIPACMEWHLEDDSIVLPLSCLHVAMCSLIYPHSQCTYLPFYFFHILPITSVACVGAQLQIDDQFHISVTILAPTAICQPFQ